MGTIQIVVKIVLKLIFKKCIWNSTIDFIFWNQEDQTTQRQLYSLFTQWSIRAIFICKITNFVCIPTKTIWNFLQQYSKKVTHVFSLEFSIFLSIISEWEFQSQITVLWSLFLSDEVTSSGASSAELSWK